MKRITKYIENVRFHTTLINVVYQFKCEKEELMAVTILCKLLKKTNRLFNTERKFYIEKLNDYIINYSISNRCINDISFINFSFLIPNDTIIQDDYLERSLLLLLNSIYDINIINEKYDDVLFNREKKMYIEALLNDYKKIDFVAEKNLLDLIDETGKFSFLRNKDLNNIEALNNEDVINVYNKYIKNSEPKIFVNGNININRVDVIFDEYLDKLSLNKCKLITGYNDFYLNKDIIVKLEKSKYKQSIVYMVYNVIDYKEEDFYKFYLISLLLSGSASNILMFNLRKKTNLVYSAGASILMKNGLLTIKANTSKNNIKLVKLVINETLNSLNNIYNYKENIERIIKKLEYDLKRNLDSFVAVASDEINKYYKIDKSSKEELEIIKKISYEDLTDLVSRLNIVCEYVLEGVN